MCLSKAKGACVSKRWLLLSDTTVGTFLSLAVLCSGSDALPLSSNAGRAMVPLNADSLSVARCSALQATVHYPAPSLKHFHKVKCCFLSTNCRALSKLSSLCRTCALVRRTSFKANDVRTRQTSEAPKSQAHLTAAPWTQVIPLAERPDSRRHQKRA